MMAATEPGGRTIALAILATAGLATAGLALAEPAPAEPAVITGAVPGEPAVLAPASHDEPVVVAGAEPDGAAGVLVPERDAAERWVWIPRALLFPLRVAAEIGFAPLRGGAWLIDRYRLRERVEELLSNDDGTLWLYPTALFATGLGLNVGARFIATDLAGRDERLALRAGYGGELRQQYDAYLSSGSRLGATTASARASFRAWNRYNYFGVGNATAEVQTRFAQRVWHGEATVRHAIAPAVAVQGVAAYTERSVALEPMTPAGFATGTHHVYGELALALDTTAPASRYISRANPSSGWLAHAFVGATEGLAGDPSHYLRYGLDARRFVDLYRGDRVLVIRAALEGVTAELGAIPVVDLPRLGGGALLRGFHEDRFRDLIAALGSAEYQFPVQSGITAFGFVDAGRVARALPDLGVRHWHRGLGGGLQFQTVTSFLFRVQIAHSNEGAFVQLALDPGRDVWARRRRR